MKNGLHINGIHGLNVAKVILILVGYNVYDFTSVFMYDVTIIVQINMTAQSGTL